MFRFREDPVEPAQQLRGKCVRPEPSAPRARPRCRRGPRPAGPHPGGEPGTAPSQLCSLPIRASFGALRRAESTLPTRAASAALRMRRQPRSLQPQPWTPCQRPKPHLLRLCCRSTAPSTRVAPGSRSAPQTAWVWMGPAAPSSMSPGRGPTTSSSPAVRGARGPRMASSMGLLAPGRRQVWGWLCLQGCEGLTC